MLKMSGNTGRLIHKLALMHFSRNTTKITAQPLLVPFINASRTLYSKASLGLDNFETQKQRTSDQLSNLEDKFKERMAEYIKDEKNMVFTEDLKNMVYLTNNDKDLELVIEMMKRFNKQNQQLRFGNFKFGSIIMRMFYLLDKPQLAMECFKDEENFPGFFDQLITFQIYLDLLYENGMYKEVLENFLDIQKKQLEGALYPRNSFVLALAACYKLNTKETLDYALNIWNKSKEHGYFPTRRAVTFCAALALNQGKPEVALELVSSCKNQNYTTVRNLKVLALVQMGRLEDALVVLKSVLSIEVGSHTFNRDVLEALKKAILERDSPELKVEMKRVEELLLKQGNIDDKTLDDQLLSTIQKPPQPLSGRQQNDRGYGGQYNRGYGGQYDDRRNENRGYNQGRSPRPNFRRERPGLEDLV